MRMAFFSTTTTLTTAALATVLLIGCGPAKSDTDGEGTSTASSGEQATASSGEQATSTPTTGMPETCLAGTVTADVSVAWGVALPPCNTENCNDERTAACSVTALDAGAPIVLTLDCMYETGPATDVITIERSSDEGVLDLVVGTKVDLEYVATSGFETGGSEELRLTDKDGPVLAYGSGNLSGQTSGDPDWGAKFVARLVAPLIGTRADAGCPGLPGSNNVTISLNDATVTVLSGNAGTLGAGPTWLVLVERSYRMPDVDYDEEALDLLVMRVKT